jgi:hypothetical protein
VENALIIMTKQGGMSINGIMRIKFSLKAKRVSNHMSNMKSLKSHCNKCLIKKNLDTNDEIDIISAFAYLNVRIFRFSWYIIDFFLSIKKIFFIYG